MAFLFQTFNILIDLLITLIFLRVILSWMVRDHSPLTDFLLRCTEPILGPIRRVLPVVAGLDFSPIIAWMLLDLLRQIVNQFLL